MGKNRKSGKKWKNQKLGEKIENWGKLREKIIVENWGKLKSAQKSRTNWKNENREKIEN